MADNRTFVYEWKTGALKVGRVLGTHFLLLLLTEMPRALKHLIKVI
jgi:hypothetical protein